MSNPFLSEIRLMSFIFPPKGWALCNGQLLPINQNQALFSLLGTTYGGDGQLNFALPDLRGRVAMHLSTTLAVPLGTKAGAESHTLGTSEIPAHSHVFNGTTPSGGLVVRQPAGALLGNPLTGTADYYAPDSNPLQPLHPSSITTTGGSQAHNNMQPYLVASYCIALQGIFPSQT